MTSHTFCTWQIVPFNVYLAFTWHRNVYEMAALLSLPAPQNKLCSERGKKNTFSFKPNVSVDVTKSSKVMSSSNEDCYFYYYSSCTKGSACSFRHEPAALQSDVVCAFWMKGSCTRPHCPFRYLGLKSPTRLNQSLSFAPSSSFQTPRRESRFQALLLRDATRRLQETTLHVHPLHA